MSEIIDNNAIGAKIARDLERLPTNTSNVVIGQANDLLVKWYPNYKSAVVGQLVLMFDARGYFEEVDMFAEYTLGHGGAYTSKLHRRKK